MGRVWISVKGRVIEGRKRIEIGEGRKRGANAKPKVKRQGFPNCYPSAKAAVFSHQTSIQMIEPRKEK